jgi:endonuclease YncB( thermonuclease family)
MPTRTSSPTLLRLSLLGALLGSLAGCTSSAEERLIDIQQSVSRLERRVDEVNLQDARLEGLETLLAMPPADEEQRAHLADLETRIITAEARLAELEGRFDAALRGVRSVGGADTASPPQRDVPGRVLTIDGGPESVDAPSLPPPHTPVSVLTVGSGALLLIQTTQGLTRVELLGLEAPQPAVLYQELPAVRARHAERLGAAAVTNDEAFQASQRHLEALISEGSVHLDYTPATTRRGSTAGAVAVYAHVDREGVLTDLGAIMIQDGYALAASDHERAGTYRVLQEEARAAGRGLWAGR